jgi:ParB family chromosome partitioning protein
VRHPERLVKQRAARLRDPDHESLEAALVRALGTRVRVRARSNGKGRIEIEYYSLEELDGLVARLVESPVAAAAY